MKEDKKSLTTTLQGDDGNGGKIAELEKLKITYKDKFWVQKQKHSEKLGGGLTGYLGDSVKFMDKVLLESDSNKATLLPLTELEEKAATIFSKTLASATRINEINTSNILAHELLGNISLDDLYKEFDGEEKVMCKALCSWINDGSHSAFDDNFYTTLDETMVVKYLEIFRQIFEKSKQISHYNMMMGITEEPEIIG